MEDRAGRARDLPQFIDAFTALPGDWEVKLSGGEPFRHPGFLGAVAALNGAGRRVSVVTNFASEIQELVEFARLTASRPGIISASLHLEYVEPSAFLQRVKVVRDKHAGSICVTCVATRENLPRLAQLSALFAAEGIAFKVQPEKQDRDVIDYNAGERERLIQLGGHNGTGQIDPCFKGRPCWAGARYFIVDHKGNAFRCYPARRYRKQRLGNLLDGSFQLLQGPEPCAYRYCNCTVPQQRGMVDTKNHTAAGGSTAHTSLAAQDRGEASSC